MTNEAVLIYETHTPIPFTCADNTGLERGAFVKLADPYTVSAVSAINDVVGGFTATEKIANDGKTKIAVYRGGIFKVKISGNVTVGDPLVFVGATGPNLLQTAAVNAEQVVGYAFETGTDAETILMELHPTVMQLA
jgi:hypothetical protein